jgi:hypothetical protein
MQRNQNNPEYNLVSSIVRHKLDDEALGSPNPDPVVLRAADRAVDRRRRLPDLADRSQIRDTN